jgi:hypothetical protein
MLAIDIPVAAQIDMPNGCIKVVSNYPYDYPEKLQSSTTSVIIAPNGGSVTVVLDVNRDWASKIEYKTGGRGWLILNPTMGPATLETTPVTFSADPNEGETRSAQVIISTGYNVVKIQVTQEGMEQ